jgi:hypothetical protein
MAKQYEDPDLMESMPKIHGQDSGFGPASENMPRRFDAVGMDDDPSAVMPAGAPRRSMSSGTTSVYRRNYGVRDPFEYDPSRGADAQGIAAAQNELDMQGANNSPPRPTARDQREYVDESVRAAELMARRAASRQARMEESERNRMSTAIESTAARIARMPPDRWASEIEKFNRLAKRTGRDQSGMMLRPEDIARAGGRQFRPTGIEGRYPQVVTDNRQMGRSGSRGQRSASGMIETPAGQFRPQSIGGRPVGVPVVDIGMGAVPDPSGLSSSQWESAYTAEDAARVSKSIYAGGMSDWSLRQRAIDSARAALTDGSLTDLEQAQGRAEIQRRENELHRDWIASEGLRSGIASPVGGGMLEGDDFSRATDPDFDRDTAQRNMQVNRRARDIMEQNPSISMDDARRIAESEATDSPLPIPSAPEAEDPERVEARNAKVNSRAREIRKANPSIDLRRAREIAMSEFTDEPIDFDPAPEDDKPMAGGFSYPKMFDEYNRIIDREMARQRKEFESLPSAMRVERGEPGLTDDMLRQALLSAMEVTGGSAISNVEMRRSLDREVQKIMSTPWNNEQDGLAAFRSVVMSHLPLFVTRIRNLNDSEAINSIVHELRAEAFGEDNEPQ